MFFTAGVSKLLTHSEAGVFESLVYVLLAVLRIAQGRKESPTAAIIDSRTLQSTPESGARAGYDRAKRRKGSKVHLAVDTLGHLLALCVTAADEQDRAQVSELAKRVQEETGETVEIAYVDQGYTGENAANAAGEHGIKLEVVKLPTAKLMSGHIRQSSFQVKFRLRGKRRKQ
jgi:transposase